MKCPDKHITNRLSTHLKVLSMTVSSLMLAPSLGNASDIELYRSATAGGANVMLVFDNSGSMDARSIGVDYKSDGVSIGTQSGNYYCAQGGRQFGHKVKTLVKLFTMTMARQRQPLLVTL